MRGRATLRAAALLAFVLTVGCGGADTVELGSPAGADAAAADADAAERDPGPDDPGPDNGPDDLLSGVPGDCALLAGADPALHEELLASLVGDTPHGPFVVVAADGVRVVATTTYAEPGLEGPSAAWLVGTDGLLAIDDLAARMSDAEVTDVDTTGGDALGSAYAQAQDCAWVAADRSAPQPPEPEPQLRPDLLVIDPSPVQPGARVALTFPEETQRGVAFQLDRSDDGAWVTTHWMTSDANGGEPATVPVGTEGYGWEDVGIGGPGPDHVLLPEDVAAGDYRICTANAVEDICAPLEITP